MIEKTASGDFDVGLRLLCLWYVRDGKQFECFVLLITCMCFWFAVLYKWICISYLPIS